jgi:hypothetical protein
VFAFVGVFPVTVAMGDPGVGLMVGKGRRKAGSLTISG